MLICLAIFAITYYYTDTITGGGASTAWIISSTLGQKVNSIQWNENSIHNKLSYTIS